MIGCWCEESFVKKIDDARGSLTRSQFCRDALSERLKRLGVEVELREQFSPDRKGKGGPTKTITSYRADTRKKKRLGDIAAQMGKLGIEAGDSKQVNPPDKKK